MVLAPLPKVSCSHSLLVGTGEQQFDLLIKAPDLLETNSDIKLGSNELVLCLGDSPLALEVTPLPPTAANATCTIPPLADLLGPISTPVSTTPARTDSGCSLRESSTLMLAATCSAWRQSSPAPSSGY